MKRWDKYKDTLIQRFNIDNPQIEKTMGLHAIKRIYYEANQQYNDLPNTIL